MLHRANDLCLRKELSSADGDPTDQAKADKITMSADKKTEAAVAAPTTTGSAPMSTSTGSVASIWLATKARITKDPTAGNIIKKSSVQKFITAPSSSKFIFEDEMLQHLVLLNT
ncbi:hypothetical protein QM012_008827 [Aureobasidium pullulans]|uniref:Uncharacterized protein n=1 Tax=Aureobasidium pullulans TaxID=5580 RepID=A0ABR0THS2_AURPU